VCDNVNVIVKFNFKFYFLSRAYTFDMCHKVLTYLVTVKTEDAGCMVAVTYCSNSSSSSSAAKTSAARRAVQYCVLLLLLLSHIGNLNYTSTAASRPCS